MTRLIHWHEGMFMRVQSLQMFQQGLLERLESLRRFGHHYPYGVVEAELSDDALVAGKVRFSRLHAVLPNGLEVIVPEESDLSPLPVREAISRSRSGEVTILLGVPDYTPNSQNSFGLGEVANTQTNLRYVPRDETRADENTGDNKQPIIVRTLNVRLLFDHEPKSGLECLPLLKVRKASFGAGAEFRVEVVPGYVPPCLYLPTPALSELLRADGSRSEPGYLDSSLPHRLSAEINLSVQLVEIARRQLSARMQDQHLGMAALQGSQFQKWIRLMALARHAARLLTLRQSSRTTPFEMFLALYEALCELEASQPRRAGSPGRTREDTILEYSHEDAMPTFTRLRIRLEKALKDVGGVEFFVAAFEPDPHESSRALAGLRPEFFGSMVSGWYLAIQTQVALLDLIPVVQNRKNFELTTPTRIDQGWGGVQLRHKPNPPPGLPDAADLYYFQVEQSNDALLQELWADVTQAKELAINRSNPQLNLTDAAFTFYATLQSNTLEQDDAV